LRLTDFDYNLPKQLIAQDPLEQRDRSRLLVVNRETEKIHHAEFSQVADFLPSPSLLVLNNTKVIPARLIAKKITGGKIEVFLLRQRGKKTWEALIKPGKRVKRGTLLEFADCELTARILTRTDAGNYMVRFRYNGDFNQILEQVGQIPLPPYIKRSPNLEDIDRYQCVYASARGAVAAPTAGLHFTPELIDQLKGRDIEISSLTLHVGLGTFQPIKTSNITKHKMHAEYFEISSRTADQINNARKQGRKIVAVGTTTVRAIESAVVDGQIRPQKGDTDIFIYPNYVFKSVDALITNFHLPKSTLLMLVSALATPELIFSAYQNAIDQEYRFYSYGDAMLIR